MTRFRSSPRALDRGPSKQSSTKAVSLRPPAHEAPERDEPLNAALDAAETLVSNIIAAGGEAPLRARLARLLPTSDDGECAA